MDDFMGVVASTDFKDAATKITDLLGVKTIALTIKLPNQSLRSTVFRQDGESEEQANEMSELAAFLMGNSKHNSNLKFGVTKSNS